MTRLTLLLLCGLPFAGKTTLAYALIKRLGWEYIALDAINRERGVGLGGQSIPPREWELTYAEAYRCVESRVLQGVSVVYDETNFRRFQRDQLRDIADRYGAAVVTIFVDVPETEARRSWQSKRATAVRNDVRDEDFENVVTNFEPPLGEAGMHRYNGVESTSSWIVRTIDLLDVNRT